MAASPERSDEQLLGVYVDQSRPSRDRELAFRELATRYRRRLFAVCLRVLSSPADAEEAVQETLVKLARGADSFRGDAKLSTWLYRVAHNVCTDRVRYEARRPSTPVEEFTGANEPAVADSSAAFAETSAVADALSQLDELSRKLLLLVSVDELSYAEAAEAAGVAVGTVKSRVSRARVALGELLTPADDASEAPTGGVANARSGSAVPPATKGPRGPP